MRELIAFMIIVALIIHFIWWILGFAAVVALYYISRAVVRAQRAATEARAQYSAEIAARAEEQHRWVLEGDDRGVYGQYPVPRIINEPLHGRDGDRA